MNCEFLNFCTLNASEQAAWVQAVGSLIAIAIAIAVPLFMDNLNKQRIKKERNSRSKVLALSILPDLYRLKVSTSHFIDEKTNPETEAPRPIDELKGNYFAHAKNFKQILAAMPDLGLYGESLSELVYLLFRAHEMISLVSRLQTSGYHAAYINNLAEFLDFARKIDAAAATLIAIIESSHDKA